jgi:malate dehydrogenase (oxaloacetate-decarboxylating)
METDVILRIKVLHRPGYLSRLFATTAEHEVIVGDISTLRIGKDYSIREVTLELRDGTQLENLIADIKKIEGIEIQEVVDRVFKRHRGGKIHMKSLVPLESIAELRDIYTPGVAKVCLAIKENPEAAMEYTGIGNTVAIVSNGSRVLGLGNIGPLASLPVMEGKALIYDKFVGISAIPILIDSLDPKVMIETVLRIAPSFGGIHLEDIRTPECFEVEQTLSEKLHQPVMHDDQHGTAVVTLAALINACKYAGKNLRSASIGMLGLGAAGFGIANLLMNYGVKNLSGTDPNADAQKRLTKIGGKVNTLEEVMQNNEIIIATTGVPDLIRKKMVQKGQIILALSNPKPEISPDDALAAGAGYAADGRSVNNLLGYPGLFKGALLSRSQTINHVMKIAASETIARFAEEGELVPSPLNLNVHQAITEAVMRAAIDSGVARVKSDRIIDDGL